MRPRAGLAFALARRDLRAGLAGLRIVLACLALGVTAIAAVGTLRAAVVAGLAADGRRILGGDIEVQGGAQPLPDTLAQWFASRHARVSRVVLTRSILVKPGGERQLVELKAVDPAWPLVGTLATRPAAASLALQDGRYGLLAEPLVVERLGLKPGDTLRLGNADFTFRGTILDEPDRVSSGTILAPRVLIAAAALPATGLIQPGSFANYLMRAALPPRANTAATIAALRRDFPNDAWRIRDPHDAVPGATRFIDQTALFMTLVGLTALLVGGVGVANGVRAWLEARARSVAILRCLGATQRLLFTVSLLQVMALCGLGIVVGVAAGAVLPLVGLRLFGDALPVPPRLGIYPWPLLLAALYGVLTALCFALWPLGRIARIAGAALFRDALLPETARPSAPIVAGVAASGAALVALVVLTGPDLKFSLWFCGAAVATLAVFRLGGAALMRLAARRWGGPLWLRLGLRHLHGPGASTPLMLVSLGLGLTTLAGVASIQGNIRRQITEQLPAHAPSFFFIDIQNDELARFEAIVRGMPGVGAVEQVPSLRARLVSVNGVPVDRVRATPGTAWALRGDRGLTYAAQPPAGTEIVAGRWWPADYDGPELVSFDAGLAEGWHVGVGDTLVVNVLGRDIPLKIANLRRIDWRSLSLNFAMVASPGVLRSAPHMHIATVSVPPAEEGAILRAVTDALPNVTGISVREVLRTLAGLLGRIGAALAATGALTLASGALVLAGSVAAGQRRRTMEAVVLKTLGATRSQIRAAWLAEFGVLGLVSGLIAAAIGSAASYGVVHYMLDAGWSAELPIVAATIGGCVLLMLALGYAGTAVALRGRAAPLLRNE